MPIGFFRVPFFLFSFFFCFLFFFGGGGLCSPFLFFFRRRCSFYLPAAAAADDDDDDVDDDDDDDIDDSDAFPLVGLRVFPALPRVARLPAQHRQEGHRPKVRPTGAASSLFWFYS